VEFCLNAFLQVSPEKREDVLQKLKNTGGHINNLTGEELRVLDNIRARKMLRSEDPLDLDHFTRDTFDGLMPNLKQGHLGLINVPKNGREEKELAELFSLEAIGEYSQRTYVV
jgi:hypothetical protein